MKKPWRSFVKKSLFVLIAGVFILGACAQAARPNEAAPVLPLPTMQTGKTSIEYPMQAPAYAESPTHDTSERDSSQNSVNLPEKRMVIKNANLAIIVADPTESMERISRMAEEMGGFVVTANMYKQTIASGVEVPRGAITIRVPAEKLNEALAKIRAESKEKPQSESQNSQDVTSDYVDLQARLKNLEAAEVELTKIMQGAHRTEDVLSVYSQLVQIREQIEVIKGQMKYYEQSAALSSIAVELIADKAVQPIEIGGWKPTGIAKEAVEALVKTMQSFVSAAIWIVIYLIPVLLVLSLVFVLPPFLIIRAWRHKRAAKKMREGQSNPPGA